MKKKLMLALLCVTAIACSAWLGYVKGKNHERIRQAASLKWSAWSAPEIIHPTPPFPTWVQQQYRTNLETGEIKVHIMAHGSARTMFEPELVTATE